MFSAWWIWGRLERALLPRARRPAASPLGAHARSARAALVPVLARVLQPGRGLLERSARRIRRSSTCSCAPPGSASAGARARSRASSLAARRCSPLPSSSAASGRPQSRGPRVVIDVGYAGVIGGDRILDGQAPYGHMPVSEGRPRVRPRQRATARSATDPAERALRDRESARRHVRAGRRTSRTSPLWPRSAGPGSGTRFRRHMRPRSRFDLLVALGLAARRASASAARRSPPLLAFGWVAFPFTAYALNSNTNDAIMPALLVWGFWLRDLARRARSARSRWPAGRSSRRCCSRRSGSRTRGFELRAALKAASRVRRSRRSPRSRSSCSSRASVTRCAPSGSHARATSSTARLAVLALGLGPVPRPRDPRPPRRADRRSRSPSPRSRSSSPFSPGGSGPLELAALTAAVLLGFELVLTHWFYLYIPWFLPFVLLALFLPRGDEQSV